MLSDLKRRAAWWLLPRLERQQQHFLQSLPVEIGAGTTIGSTVRLIDPWNLRIGARTDINDYVVILARGGVTIGDDVMIAAGSQIISATHSTVAAERVTIEDGNRRVEVDPVSIEDQVWIGAGAIVLPGVTIGRGAVVGAGAVVSRDVPAATTVKGIPAR